MKIAICFAGEPRFFQKGAEHMSSFYKGCEVDYFIHSWAKAESIEKTHKELNEFFSPKKLMVEPYMNFDNFFGENGLSNFQEKMKVPWQHGVSFLRSNYQVGKLLESDPTEYDYVAFSRTDVAADGCLLNILNEKPNRQKIYTSYVNGDVWMVDANNEHKDNHLDTKFVCSNKEAMVWFSKLYENLFKYIIQDKRPFCHHRLYFHHLKHIIKEYGHELLAPNKDHIIGGWSWIRNNKLTDY